jgi:hypothetical protein
MWKLRPSVFHYEIQGIHWKWMYGVGWWQIMSLIPSSSTSWLTRYGYLHIIATFVVGQICHGSTFQHDGTPTSPQYTLHFLKSEISSSVYQMTRAHYMSTHVTPLDFFYGDSWGTSLEIHDEHCIPTESSICAGTEGMHHKHAVAYITPNTLENK